MTGGRKPHRHLTAEEYKLWKAVARQFRPLIAGGEQSDTETDAVATASPTVAPQTRPAQRALKPSPAAKPKVAAPAIGEFESRRARRLAAGKLPIEARLDLHGMRQDEAHDALLRFLRRAQSEGLQHVKVITGKGQPGDNDEMRPFDLNDFNRRGVLRDAVPRWLAGSSARALVVSFTQASRGHGGSGALYIQIRKAGKR